MGVAEFMGHARRAGADGVGLTLAALAAHDPEELAKLATEHDLFISTLNSAGYFLFADGDDRARQDALNARLIEVAARPAAEGGAVL